MLLWKKLIHCLCSLISHKDFRIKYNNNRLLCCFSFFHSLATSPNGGRSQLDLHNISNMSAFNFRSPLFLLSPKCTRDSFHLPIVMSIISTSWTPASFSGALYYFIIVLHHDCHIIYFFMGVNCESR